jgi:DNA-directed RNA polymerase subunit E'/Rpb7
MFYLSNIERAVRLHPKHIGANPRAVDKAIEEAVDAMEGSCDTDEGYLVSALRIKSVEARGVVEDRTGHVLYRVRIAAALCRLEDGEVTHAVVKSMLPGSHDVIAMCGPIKMTIKLDSRDYEYDASQCAFLPLEEDRLPVVKKGEPLCVRATRVRTHPGGISAVGEIA